MNWHQLRTILWLRWRLSKNQRGRAGAFNAVLSVAAIVIGIVLGAGGLIGGFFAGRLGLANASPQITLLVWDAVTGAFLSVWALGILTEIQRSETIDIGRLLYLPISLKEIFLVNYLASHFTLTIILTLPAMLGLVIGVATVSGLATLVLLPLASGFVFMITAWTYCLRGWLVSLMVNKRRRRAILVGITTAFILLGQIPNLYFNMTRDRSGKHANKVHSVQPETPSPTGETRSQPMQLPAGLLTAHNYIPPLWVANGAMKLAHGNVWPAVLGSFGVFVIGALGLRRAYLGTLRFYQGQPSGKPAKAERIETPIRQSGTPFLERQFRGVPEEATALALATFRSVMRAPEIKMALATSFAMLLVFGTMLFARAARAPSEMAKPFIATGTVAFILFGMLQPMFNQFGFDRDGFRSFILLPAKRKYVLLGKNLAFLPIVFGPGLLSLVALYPVVHLTLTTLLAAVFQLTATYLLVCMVGNFVSITAPYRIAAGSLKPTKMPIKTSLLIFLSHLLFPVAMIPVFIPAVVELMLRTLDWAPMVPVNLILSVVLVAIVAFFYRFSLEGLGEFLGRREKDILLVVSQEVE